MRDVGKVLDATGIEAAAGREALLDTGLGEDNCEASRAGYVLGCWTTHC